jgi:hypothetical protein
MIVQLIHQVLVDCFQGRFVVGESKACAWFYRLAVLDPRLGDARTRIVSGRIGLGRVGNVVEGAIGINPASGALANGRDCFHRMKDQVFHAHHDPRIVLLFVIFVVGLYGRDEVVIVPIVPEMLQRCICFRRGSVLDSDLVPLLFGCCRVLLLLLFEKIGALLVVRPVCRVRVLAHALHPPPGIADRDDRQDIFLPNVHRLFGRVLPLVVCGRVFAPSCVCVSYIC